MYLLFVDTETTGVDQKRSRLVQLAWLIADEHGRIFVERNMVINPSGFSIPTEATKIHGISTEYAANCGVEIDDALIALESDICRADVIIGHNLSFDLSILRTEFLNSQMTSRLDSKRHFCTMRASTQHCRLPSLNGRKSFKWPTLKELHEKVFGESFENQHDALSDIQATARCFFELYKQRIFLLSHPGENEKASGLPSRRSEDADIYTFKSPHTHEESAPEEAVTEEEEAEEEEEEEEEEVSNKYSEMNSDEIFIYLIEADSLNEIYNFSNQHDINSYSDQHGWHFIHHTTHHDKSRFINSGVFENTAVHLRTRQGLTPLHLATKRKVASALINLGADVNAPSKHHSLPIHHAAAWADAETMDLLISKGACPLVRCKESAFVFERVYTENICHDFGWAEPDFFGYCTKTKEGACGGSILHWAALGGNLETMKYILEKYLAINDLDESKNSAVHFASHKALEYLLSSGASARHRNNLGAEPVHIASWNFDFHSLMSLFKFGAMFDTFDNYGRSPLHYTIIGYRDNYTDRVSYREREERNFSIRPFLRKKALIQTLKTLLDSEGVVDRKDEFGDLAIEMAESFLKAEDYDILDILRNFCSPR